uniref:Insulin like growth factor binding protein 7 n=1 Tax=Anas platyrhynchos TaxID=8839 RepID=A0A8B9QU43_ANAPL
MLLLASGYSGAAGARPACGARGGGSGGLRAPASRRGARPLSSRRGCPLGRVRDACCCCWHCVCVKSRKRRKAKSGSEPAAGPAALPEWVCSCVQRPLPPVCGSDGRTYGERLQSEPPACGAQSRVAAGIAPRSKGCFCLFAGPSIVTPPKDIWNVTGAQIYLSCEVMGIPTPVLIWNKIIRGQHGVQRMELLPGDRENLAIQTRGGPEKHEVTGWVLITPLNKEDEGEYECHASNAKGEATASAKIHVVETLNDIALNKEGPPLF